MDRVNNPDVFYQAMLSRDSRFDGLFFVGVTSTGIYCRSICPAPKPKFKNVRFYSSSAGAESAGFRPCKRCRPDASAGTPIWSGASKTVSRALELIGNGYLDEHNVAELGAGLDISDRQLRRLFKTYLGASPNAIALTRRLDFARKLIDETQLSMTDIAFNSGFESIRRFNDAVKKRFSHSPSDLRELAKNLNSHNNNKNKITLRLPFRPPLNWHIMLNYFKGRQIQGVEVIDDNSYSRSIRFKGNSGNGKRIVHQGILSVTLPAQGSFLELTLHVHSVIDLMKIVYRVRRIFDLEADPIFIADNLKRDPALNSLVTDLPGLRVPGGWSHFEIAVRTIIGQQVSISGANTVTARIVQRFGEAVDASFVPGITHFFPTASRLANADLSGIGMPGKRMETIKTLSSKVASGEIDLEQVGNAEAIKVQLMKLPGIGDWTTQYIAMRALREPDAFPASDLALKRELKEMSLTATEKNIKRPEIWRPWRAYAAMYLWKKYGEQHK
jgi:AraC family transcriptional regulator, regulatory protein of adaptative response / DNA-3-methyladenine glycosylase II